MSADVIRFRDPDAPLDGQARDAALKLLRDVCREIAAQAVSRGFTEVCKTPGCGELSIEDALPVFVEAMRRQLSRADIVPPATELQ
jgi:hypothetical protein